MDSILSKKVSSIFHKPKTVKKKTPITPIDDIEPQEYYLEENFLFEAKSTFLKTLLESLNK